VTKLQFIHITKTVLVHTGRQRRPSFDENDETKNTVCKYALSDKRENRNTGSVSLNVSAHDVHMRAAVLWAGKTREESPKFGVVRKLLVNLFLRKF